MDPLVQATAQRHDIDPLLLHALAHVESRHRSEAVSPAGARGLMQLMPATARGVGVADGGLHEPAQNLEASARYLKLLQQRFGNELSLVLAAYNAGEGAVERHGRRVPPYAETQAYVRDVLALYRQLRLRLLAPGLRAKGRA
ncbi:lytic transglycosylase domain-containing protein [Paucibacter sp. APW11]|uniref:Lytic transglycosylase domain-containing protein n=1 Tax=Roseateles aquae TaxID=3077235 RepID=A0ABU3PEE1_9BURK|nr:lytic transglycosylase domain-containing protein [Paucibacter sp. APW11]MDT9000939.1 lytic transglycosylase domain-containing protein [Paucibacter sp. APW11]